MLFLYSHTFFLFLGKRIFHSSIPFVIRICGLSSMTLTMTLETSAAKTPLVLQSVDLDRLALSFTWHHPLHRHHHQIHRQYRVQARTGTIYSFFLDSVNYFFEVLFSRQCRLFCWFFSLLSVNCHSSSQSMSPLTIISEGHCRSGHQKRLSIITITMIIITITITTMTVTMAIKRQISLSPSP